MINRTLLFVLLFSLISAHGEAKTLYMAGDSTMAIKDPKDFPETGWGMPFAHFFASELNVVNLAKNGRSTRTFISEGLWDQIESNISKGDFVFIQFGHNDESEHKTDRYTTPQEYKRNLTMMITVAREKGAVPVLLTPVTRRYFEGETIKETHPYSKFVREVAGETHVSLVDLDTISRQYFSEMGEPLSALRYMHIRAGLHPNYPYGVKDNTHFNQLGAREVAQLVLKSLKRINSPLVNFLRKPDPKHLKLSYD